MSSNKQKKREDEKKCLAKKKKKKKQKHYLGFQTTHLNPKLDTGKSFGVVCVSSSLLDVFCACL